ncbi:hypothetical protein Tco_0065396 [Tanacetum coccineum]
MDWLSRHKAEIVCHEKVVRIPLPNGEMLRVLGERPEEKVRHLLSAKVEDQKLKDIIVVRNVSEGEERERAFQILKDKLCNAHVLAYPDGPEDFMIELFNDYDCEIRYHPVEYKDRILAAQNEASKAVNAPAKMLRGLDDQIEHRSDGALYYLDRIWVPLTGDVRTLIIDEAHKSKYSVHP